MTTPDPRDAFFLIVADLDAGLFCVEGPMSDDAPVASRRRPRQAAAQSSRPVRPDRPRSRRACQRFQRTHGFAGVPPGSIVRPRA